MKDKIDSLDVFDKLKIYFHYMVVQLSMKHNFQVVDKTPLKPMKYLKDEISWKVGRGNPDKEYGNIALYYLWKDLNPISFEKFLEGEIYTWYSKFQNELNK
jgi:hypothetical protein